MRREEREVVAMLLPAFEAFERYVVLGACLMVIHHRHVALMTLKSHEHPGKTHQHVCQSRCHPSLSHGARHMEHNLGGWVASLDRAGTFLSFAAPSILVTLLMFLPVFEVFILLFILFFKMIVITFLSSLLIFILYGNVVDCRNIAVVVKWEGGLVGSLGLHSIAEMGKDTVGVAFMNPVAPSTDVGNVVVGIHLVVFVQDLVAISAKEWTGATDALDVKVEKVKVEIVTLKPTEMAPLPQTLMRQRHLGAGVVTAKGGAKDSKIETLASFVVKAGSGMKKSMKGRNPFPIREIRRFRSGIASIGIGATVLAQQHRHPHMFTTSFWGSRYGSQEL
ncbi:hypothetical protein BKA70DRAFT_249199 [Coprinopsis sp. MPI-PUGE-AT-0042]|nr:hypothetical protein BKA70DRAFT_249199 [Coprinopsis sp. MPI-PUGE-AT-0042]